MNAIPSLGLGTWKIAKDVVAETVYNAIKDCGIRHLDCACDYGNEIEVGMGINKAITDGIVTREELWITSKLWNTFHSPEHVELACKKTLSDLNLSYLDCYLIHFPISMKFVPIETRYPPEWIHDPTGTNPRIELVKVPLHKTWEAMESLVDTNLSRFIGVSNFNVQLLGDLLSYARIAPHCNQVELHPYLPQTALVDFCARNNVKAVALSPFGGMSYVELGVPKDVGGGLLRDETITTIGTKYNKSVAQVLLRWNVQRGVGVIPKSSGSHLLENTQIHDFTLSGEDMTALTALGSKNIRFNDPGEFCKGMGGAIPIYD